MLTYTPPGQRVRAKITEKPWILLLLAFAWLWPGVFGHDLWRPGEPWLGEVVRQAAAGGGALRPSLFGEAYFDAPPVYVALAALLRRILPPQWVDAYAAMRLAGVMFTALGLAACGTAAYRFLGKYQGRTVVLVCIGCAGLIVPAHFLSGVSVQFAALGLCLYGFSLAKTRIIAASALLGGGWALWAASAGYLAAGALMLAAVLLWLTPPWRNRRYAVALVGASAVALPLMLVYPLMLYYSRPEAFDEWMRLAVFGAFGGTETFSLSFSLFYYLKNLLWFAFPAWPLAAWTAWRGKLPQQDWGVLALVWLSVCTLLLAWMPQRFQDNLIWLLPPLALLAAACLDSLRRGAAAFLNWFGITAFGLLAAFLWLGFVAMNFGWPAKLAERSAYFSPYYVPQLSGWPVAVGLLFTLLWLRAVTRRHIKGRQAVTNWAAGMTLVWALLMTLWLPWLDAAKSYRPVVAQMERAAPADLRDGRACVSLNAEDTLARLVWREYGRTDIRVGGDCAYRLLERPQFLPDGWTEIWRGGRPRNRTEYFVLLKKAV
ncbi:glycosyltransferase family 39 protein [Neisseria leonii]|uniref:glycosyltransferase family 39 protein n=1 Tax=Neisseria leonii TaxID=2995413 RepID=UPI00237BBD0D|nr:glycosyltransferase family 39 protein [Neisseria sp. 3986]MDD9324947.1 glycosyltransferase family 39 protein [Neisseria sp. 3986]